MPATDVRFVAPLSVSDALEALAVPDSFAVAGGTSMALLVREGLLEPTQLVSLGRIPELVGITRVGDFLQIGAMTTLRELAASGAVREHAPTAALAAAVIGNPRVRAVATVGGAVCHADAREDLPPALLVSGALVNATGPSGARTIDLADFFVSLMETTLAEGEIVTGVSIPISGPSNGQYRRFTPNSADDWPTIGVAVSLSTDEAGVVSSAKVALGGAGPTALLVPAAGAALVGSHPGDSEVRRAAGIAAASCDPPSDGRGSAEYRRAMVEVEVRRAIHAALVESGVAAHC